MAIPCDVLVVGAGASGSVATLYLSKKGFDVTVIEKQPAIGVHSKEKIDITEDFGLSPIIEELKLSVKEKTNKTRWFSHNNSFKLESKIYDFYLKRGPSLDSFEVGAMKSSIDKGANVLLETEPKKFNFKNNIIDSVRIAKETIKPKIVIGADGFESSVLKNLQIKEERIATIAGYGIMGENFNLPEAETYIFLDSKNAPGGYFFVAKTKDDEGVACVVVDKSMANESLKKYYENFIEENKHLKEILKNPNVKNEFTGMTYAGFLEKRTSENLILVGDAARTLDPFLGYGMRNSIISGYVAGEIVAEALEKDNVRIIGEYEKELISKISDISRGAKMRKIFRKLDNDDVDYIVKTLEDLQEQGIDLDDIFNEKQAIAKKILGNIPVNLRLALRVFSAFLH
jgi:digeranylgeranylglycerophospholipid reductase